MSSCALARGRDKAALTVGRVGVEAAHIGTALSLCMGPLPLYAFGRCTTYHAQALHPPSFASAA